MSALGNKTEAEYRRAPLDLEVEQALLGMFIARNRVYWQVVEETDLAPDDFSEGLHQRIFEEIARQIAQNDVVSPLSLSAAMKADPGLLEVGGHDYLVKLAHQGPGLVDKGAKDCARALRQLAMRRALVGIGTDMIEMAHDPSPSASAEAMADEISDRIFNAIQGGEGEQGGAVSASDSAYVFLRELEEPERKHATCPTGLTELDDILGGLHDGNLIIAAGRPGMGKTTLGTHFALAAGARGIPADYYSIEMPNGQISARLLAEIAYDFRTCAGDPTLHYSRLINRKARPSDMDMALKASERLADLEITILDKGAVTMARIGAIARSRARRFRKKRLTIIDHLGLVTPDDRYSGRKVDEIGEITKASKNLAKELSCPVVLLAQLSRRVEDRLENDRRPKLSDLRDSGNIEQDADVVLGLFRGSYYVAGREKAAKKQGGKAYDDWVGDSALYENRLEISVLKNRNGASDRTVTCFVDIAASTIRDSDPFDVVEQNIQGLLP